MLQNKGYLHEKLKRLRQKEEELSALLNERFDQVTNRELSIVIYKIEVIQNRLTNKFYDKHKTVETIDKYEKK